MTDQQLSQYDLIETLPTAFSRHRIVLGNDGRPLDYIFLQVNAAFEQMTGLKRDQVIGKKVTEVLPGIEKDEFDWIDVYCKVALGGGCLNFEQYSEHLKRWYAVEAYSDKPGYFTTVFNEITARREELTTVHSLLELSEKLIASNLASLDYNEPVETLQRVSGAKFAAINTYQEGRTKTVTRAIAGVPAAIFTASQTLGFSLTGRAWDIKPERLHKIKGGKLVRFRSLFETAMGAINETTAFMLQELFGIGDIYVIELTYGGGETMGDIIFFMSKGKLIQNHEIIELYAGQIGSLLSRLKAEEALSIANKNMTTVLENSLFGVAIIDKNRRIRWVNPVVCKLAGVESPDQIIGSQCGEYLCPAEQHECPILDKGQKLDNSERILRRNDGQTIPILKSVTEIMLEGEEVLLETFIDITERKQAEQLLQARVDLMGFSTTNKLDAVLQRTLDEVCKVVQSPIGFYHFVSPDEKQLTLKAWSTDTLKYFCEMGEKSGMQYSVDKAGIWVDCLRQREPVIHNNYTSLPYRKGLPDGHAPVVRELVVPIMRNDRIVAILGVGNKKQDFTANDVQVVSYFADIAWEIAERKQAEEALAERLAFEKIISSISSNFINLPLEQIDGGINYALKNMGEFLVVDRTYLYRFSEDGKTYSITHIWCRDGVEGYFEKDQNFPVELTPWWVGELKNGRYVSVADIAQMPEEYALDRADFLSEGIKSLFTLPLIWEGEVFGCFGFDTVYENRVWTEEQVGLLQVVTELISGAIARHDADRQIHILSFHDQLTGLYNRRYYANELDRLNSSREHPVAVISADLDGLKLINDTIGHSEGDRYLQAGAEVLKSALRASDILARVGGDEFALLLPRTDKVAAELLVNRIRRRIEQYNLEQKRLPLSISLGLAVSESTEYPLEEIYRLADNNMYTNKLQQGKKARAEIVSSLLSSLFERGNLAEGERDQVQELAIRLGQALKLPEGNLARLALLAQVYDLGKVGLPDSTIHSSMQSNTGNLADAEREALHRHPESGYRIASSSPELADIADLILKHHENYDGKGYPLGLKGDAIPIECRILSLAIAYSAMTNPRPYAKTLTPTQALDELNRCAGSQFDPVAVETFVRIMQ